jgi:hypothetical protein
MGSPLLSEQIMSLPPFDLELFLPEGNYSGPFRLTLIPTPEEPGETLEEVDYAGALDLLRLFARAVNLQLFHSDPALPVMEMKDPTVVWLEKDKQCEMVGHVNNLPAYAWLILAAMLNKTHLALETLVRMSVIGEDVMTPLSKETLEALAERNEPLADSLPFDAELDNLDIVGRLFNIEMEFAAPLSDEQYEWIKDALDCWSDLVMLGGFDLEFSDDEELGSQGKATRLLPNIIQYSQPDYTGDFSGFEVLLNLIQYIHQHQMTVVNLSIE